MTLKPTVLVAEDESALVTLLRYNLEREGYRVLEAQDGEEALLVANEQAPRPRAARLDAAATFRHRSVPTAARPAGNAQRAHHHADCARRGDRSHSRPRYGCGRLHHQAVLDDGAAGAAARRDAPNSPEPGRRRGAHRRHRNGPRGPSRAPRRLRHPSGPDRIQAARPSDPASRPRVQPRAIARCGVGLRCLCRSAHSRRPCRPVAQGAQHAAACTIPSAPFAPPVTRSTTPSSRTACKQGLRFCPRRAHLPKRAKSKPFSRTTRKVFHKLRWRSGA